MSYTEERFEKIFGGSISLTGNNVPISFIKDCKFVNNFGRDGAALNFNRGGGLYLTDTVFVLESDFKTDSDWGEEGVDPTAELQLVYDASMLDIYKTYRSSLSQSFLFDRDMFDEIKII